MIRARLPGRSALGAVLREDRDWTEAENMRLKKRQSPSPSKELERHMSKTKFRAKRRPKEFEPETLHTHYPAHLPPSSITRIETLGGTNKHTISPKGCVAILRRVSGGVQAVTLWIHGIHGADKLRSRSNQAAPDGQMKDGSR